MSDIPQYLREMTVGYLAELRVVADRSKRVRAGLVNKLVGIKTQIASHKGDNCFDQEAKKQRMKLRKELLQVKDCIQQIDQIIYSITKILPK